MFLFTLLIGLAMLVVGAELLVRGGGQLALAMRIPALVVGLTIVAFGTSAPEMTVSIMAALEASPTMAMANVTGSNIANIALVLGLAAMVNPLLVPSNLGKRDIPSLIVLQLLMLGLSLDGTFGFFDGLTVFCGGLLYNAWLFWDVFRGRATVDNDLNDYEKSNPLLDLLMLVVGIAILLVGANLFVNGASQLAYAFNLSERFVGLTVVALGTSAPEVATAITSSRKGEVDLAVGNSLGSNILNISLALGITAMIAPIDLNGQGFFMDLTIALLVTLLLVPMWLFGKLSRLSGGLLAVGYLGYILFGYLNP